MRKFFSPCGLCFNLAVLKHSMSKGNPIQKMLTAVGAVPRIPFCYMVVIAFILDDKLTNGDDARLIGDNVFAFSALSF